MLLCVVYTPWQANSYMQEIEMTMKCESIKAGIHEYKQILSLNKYKKETLFLFATLHMLFIIHLIHPM